MKGLVGALCWWGAWGPGPLPPPLKSGPVGDKNAYLNVFFKFFPNVITSIATIQYYY